jgi:hypothetical protein
MDRWKSAAFVAMTVGAMALAGCSSNVGTGAAGGAVTGAVVGGPVGAAVGGVAGAAVGAAVTPDDTVRVRQYVVTQRRPSVRVRDEVVVGYQVPRRVRVYPVPPEVGLRTSYSYAIINDRPVLIEPTTREVVTILE